MSGELYRLFNELREGRVPVTKEDFTELWTGLKKRIQEKMGREMTFLHLFNITPALLRCVMEHRYAQDIREGDYRQVLLQITKQMGHLLGMGDICRDSYRNALTGAAASVFYPDLAAFQRFLGYKDCQYSQGPPPYFIANPSGVNPLKGQLGNPPGPYTFNPEDLTHLIERLLQYIMPLANKDLQEVRNEPGQK